jgi:hypothetical protein
MVPLRLRAEPKWVSINGVPNSWMVFVDGKSVYKWMIWGYPYFRKPPNGYGKWEANGNFIEF